MPEFCHWTRKRKWLFGFATPLTRAFAEPASARQSKTILHPPRWEAAITQSQEVKRESRGKLCEFHASAKVSRWHSRRHRHGRTAPRTFTRRSSVVRAHGSCRVGTFLRQEILRSGELASRHAHSLSRSESHRKKSGTLARLRFCFFRARFLRCRPGRGRLRPRRLSGSQQFQESSNVARRPAVDTGSECRASGRHSRATEESRLRLRLHRHQSQLLHRRTSPGSETTRGRFRPRKNVCRHYAGRIRRGLSWSAFA